VCTEPSFCPHDYRIPIFVVNKGRDYVDEGECAATDTAAAAAI